MDDHFIVGELDERLIMIESQANVRPDPNWGTVRRGPHNGVAVEFRGHGRQLLTQTNCMFPFKIASEIKLITNQQMRTCKSRKEKPKVLVGGATWG